MKDCAYCINQRHLEGPEGEYAPCPACRTRPEPHRDPRAAMEAAVRALEEVLK